MSDRHMLRDCKMMIRTESPILLETVGWFFES